MEVADRLVVLKDGRVEQEGAPRDLYERPANDFVMGFLGPVTRLGGRLVRPHDIEVTTRPGIVGGTRGRVERVTRIGFEVRLVVRLLDDGQPSRQDQVEVAVTRATQRRLGLTDGVEVWLAVIRGAAVPQMRPGVAV